MKITRCKGKNEMGRETIGEQREREYLTQMAELW
jgi:hypothetical protein